MNPEIVGQQLRIRVRDPKQFESFLIQDVGLKGRLQRVVGVKDGKYFLQSWHFNLDDYRSLDDLKRELFNVKNLSGQTRVLALRLAKDYMVG